MPFTLDLRAQELVSSRADGADILEDPNGFAREVMVSVSIRCSVECSRDQSGRWEEWCWGDVNPRDVELRVENYSCRYDASGEVGDNISVDLG
jgi:hypothetical protein